MAPPQPDREELNTKINAIRSKIESLNEDLERLKERDQQRDDANSTFKKERDGLQGLLKEQRGTIKELQDLKQNLRERVAQIDKEKQELRKKQQEFGKGPPTALKEIDAEIRRLEFSLETSGSTSLKREKAIIAQIKTLQDSKKTAKERESIESKLSSLDDERRGLIEQIQEKQTEIEAKRTEQDKLRGNLQDVSTKTAPVNNVRQERAKLLADIRACKDEMRVLRDNFNEEMDKWQKLMEEERRKEREKREAEKQARLERQAKIAEERRKKKEEEERLEKEAARIKRLNPYEDEITIIDGLVAFLQSDKPADKPKPVVQNFDANLFAKQGMQAFKRDDQDEWLFADRTKKKPAKPKPSEPVKTEEEPPKPKPKAEKKAPPISAARWNAFDKVGVKPPLKGSEVHNCIEELKKKKTYFESFKKTLAQIEAEDAEQAKKDEEARKKRQAEAEADRQAQIKKLEEETSAREAAGQGVPLPEEEAEEEEAEKEENGEDDGELVEGEEGDASYENLDEAEKVEDEEAENVEEGEGEEEATNAVPLPEEE